MQGPQCKLQGRLELLRAMIVQEQIGRRIRQGLKSPLSCEWLWLSKGRMKEGKSEVAIQFELNSKGHFSCEGLSVSWPKANLKKS